MAEDGQLTSARPRMVLWVLLVAQTMATMDNSIVTVATETIRRSLHATGGELQLVLSGYTLTFSILVVTGARLGSGLGHRKLFLLGLAGFTLSSMLSGIAPVAVVLVLGRILQGLFAAMLVPQVFSVIQLLFTGPARARAIASYSMILALGVAGGQILGGAVVSADLWGQSWRIAFLINVPIGLVLLVLAARTLPAHTPTATFRLDLSGIGLLAVSMLALVVPLVFGREHGWPPWAFGCLLLGMLLFPAFGWFELRLASRGGQPILELEALRAIGVRPGLIACCILNFAFAGLVFPLTLHSQSALGYSPIEAGLMFLPFPIGFAAVSEGAVRLREAVQAALPVLGMLLFAGAMAALAAIVSTGFNEVLVSVALLLGGAGMAAGFSTLMTQTAAAIDPKYGSALSAMISTGTLLASVLAVSAIGGIYLSEADGHPDRSAAGLEHALIVNAVLLAVGSGLALRTLQISRRFAQRPVQRDDDAEVVATAASSGSESVGRYTTDSR